MLPPKKPAQSVTLPNHRNIYFPNPINYYKHLDWEGQMWEELAVRTTSGDLEPCESAIGELAVRTSIDLSMAIDLAIAPTTNIQ